MHKELHIHDANQVAKIPGFLYGVHTYIHTVLMAPSMRRVVHWEFNTQCTRLHIRIRTVGGLAYGNDNL